jgi:hypothetical protein
MVWQDGEQINWEGKEEVVKSATWDLIQLYLCETPIAPDEKPEAVEVGVEADLSGHGLPLLVGVIDLVRLVGELSISRHQLANQTRSCSHTQLKPNGLATASCTGKLLATKKTGLRFTISSKQNSQKSW